MKRANGSTASLMLTALPTGASPPSPTGRKKPSLRRVAMESPTAIRAAALASEMPVAFETNGTVREARGLASKTYKIPLASAY